MTLANYGVWVAKAVRVSAESAQQDPQSPHIHLFYDDGSGGPAEFQNSRRASINVKSDSKISELVFWIAQDFDHPIVEKIRGLPMGFRNVPSQPGGLALDLLRANLVDFKKGRVLPHDVQGEQNDIIDFVMPELQAAINRKATIYLFGIPYDDKGGIHDIHMNQGSVKPHKQDNGIWQDGGIIMHFEDEDRFSAIFLAFASQAAHTDEVHGDGLPGSQTLGELVTGEIIPTKPTIADDLRVAIIAALVNPIGGENRGDPNVLPEMVYLLNRSTTGISLAGWSLLNKEDQPYVLSADVWLAAGECRKVTMGKVPLSNSGGLISLLDKDGHKVDGVSYSKEQASKEGELVIFR